jgi:ribosomal peptide maturation radical SAM protein 1
MKKTKLNHLNILHDGEIIISLKDWLPPGDILLLVPPLAEITAPYIGIHQLQAACKRENITATVLYLNNFFSILMGRKLHSQIALDHSLLLGDRLFSTAAFGFSSIDRWMQKVRQLSWVPEQCWQVKGNNDAETIPPPVVSFRELINKENWEDLEKNITDWIQELSRQIAAMGFSIVGTSSTFGGLVPAVALLNTVKKENPGITTVLGGALCDGEMSQGIESLNAGIDYIFSGEGDISFPKLAKRILSNDAPPEKIIFGEKVADLNTLPLPVFSDYFDQISYLSEDHLPDKGPRTIVYETSRGCWIGKCTFCGLTGKRNHYRFKKHEKVFEDLNVLMKRDRMDIVFMTDCIMPLHYLNTLLPEMAGQFPGIEIKYEMKANLSLTEMLKLKDAGISEIQPGIESLSPTLLKRMRKPFSVRGNLETLRYARSVGIDLKWLLLFGFPGDEIREYEEMVQLLPLLHHLPPPYGLWPLRLCRFSKYHSFPDEFQITDMQPAEVHQDLYPPHADLDKLAFYFTGKFSAESHENPGVIIRLWKEYQAWANSWAPYEVLNLEFLRPQLHLTRSTKDTYILNDSRGLPGGEKRQEISPELASTLMISCPLKDVSQNDLDFMREGGYGVVVDSWLVSLVTAEPSLIKEFEKNKE